MDISKSFGTDKEAAENGKWFDLENGGRVKVAKLGCLAFKAEVQRLQKPFLAILNSSMDSSAVIDKITTKAMAKTILLDWSDISMDGADLPYSVEKAKELLRDYPDFREVISALSAERRHFQPKDIVEK